MEEAVRMRIVKEASELFNAKGYRSVTLSELATRLGMSKKTLYLHFSGKEEIAEAVLDQTLAAIASTVAEHTMRDGDPLQILKQTFNSIKHEIMKLHPIFLEDIQKHIPGLWERVEAFRGRQLAFVEELLVRAERDGLIRNVNTRLVSTIMLESIQHLVRPDFAARNGFTMVEVADALFDLFNDGIRMDRKQ